MTKKDILIIILKVVIYACTLLLAGFGVASVTGCTASRDVVSDGHTRIISVDTTNVHHKGTFSIKLK